MISKDEVLQRLKECREYKFIALLGRFRGGLYLVRLHVSAFELAGLESNVIQQNFYVRLVDGCLSATSVDGVLHIENLT